MNRGPGIFGRVTVQFEVHTIFFTLLHSNAIVTHFRYLYFSFVTVYVYR